MKSMKMAKALSPLLVIAVALFLVAGAVTALVPQTSFVHQTASAKIGNGLSADLTVVIDSPADGATFSICQNFTVNVTVNNTGVSDITGVEVTIYFDALIDLVSPDANYTIGDINVSENKTAVWDLHCNGSGTSVIWVNVTAGTAATVENATITIHQQSKPHLVVDITSPVDGTNFNTCQDFTLTANVTNDGEANATGVKVKVSFNNAYVNLQAGEDAEHVIGSINGSETKQESWGLHCNGSGTTLISVNITAGNDANTDEPIPAQNIVNDTVTVNQHPLSISFTPATCQNYTVNQTFMVNVTVNNTGGATVNNVNVTIAITGNANTTENLTKPIGNITAGGNGTVNWILTCTGSGDVNITISATGTDNNTSLPVDAAPVTHTVHQHPLSISFTPATCQNYTVGQSFMVNVTVTNTGGATVNNVNVTITITGNATTTENLTKPASPWDITGGGSGTVSWTLNCTGSGDVNITISATGTDNNTSLEVDATPVTHTVHQHSLSISFTPATCQNYTVGQSFMVNVTVTNPGNATVNNVNVTIAIAGNANTTENLTKPIGNIAGGGNGTVSWNLTCNGTGDVSITISATGTDNNTSLAVDATPVTHTVHQQTPAALSISFTPATCQNYTVGQSFMVNVTVSNTGQATADNVDVTIAITGNANTTESLTKHTSPWNIPGAGSGTVSWNVNCTGAGDVSITISAAGKDANTDSTVDATPVTHTVHQQEPAALTISFTPLTCQNYSVGQSFMVNVTVSNTGGATVNNVDVTIAIAGNANTTENLTKPASPWNIPSGGSGTVSWNLTCNGTGDVNITISATGTDANTNLTVNATPVTHTVHQQEPAALTITFTPATCENYAVGQEFLVSVTVSNTGGATADNVDVTIAITNVTGNATTTENLTKPASPWDITGGGSGTVSWTLTCTGAGDVNITISATGTDANTNLTVNATPVTHTVHQQEPGGLSGGAIAGIVIGSIAGAIIIFFAVRRWVWRS